MDKDAKQRAEERRNRITNVQFGKLEDMEDFHLEDLKWWQTQSSLDRISVLMNIIHTSYAMKGIDVTQRRLQGSIELVKRS